MPFKIGNKSGSKIYKGTTEISKVFKGETLVFSGAEYYLEFDGVDDYATAFNRSSNNYSVSDFTWYYKIGPYNNTSTRSNLLDMDAGASGLTSLRSGYALSVQYDTNHPSISMTGPWQQSFTFENLTVSSTQDNEIVWARNGGTGQVTCTVNGQSQTWSGPSGNVQYGGYSNNRLLIADSYRSGNSPIPTGNYTKFDLKDLKTWNAVVSYNDRLTRTNDLAHEWEFQDNGNTLVDIVGSHNFTITGATWVES